MPSGQLLQQPTNQLRVVAHLPLAQQNPQGGDHPASHPTCHQLPQLRNTFLLQLIVQLTLFRREFGLHVPQPAHRQADDELPANGRGFRPAQHDLRQDFAQQLVPLRRVTCDGVFHDPLKVGPGVQRRKLEETEVREQVVHRVLYWSAGQAPTILCSEAGHSVSPCSAAVAHLLSFIQHHSPPM